MIPAGAAGRFPSGTPLATALAEVGSLARSIAGDPLVDGRPTVTFIVGPRESGKSSLAAALAKQVSAQGMRIGGFIAVRLLANGRTVGYDLHDLAAATVLPLARLSPPGVAVGRYFLDRDAIAAAQRSVAEAITRADVMFIDEVGPLELRGEGHATSLGRLAAWKGLLVVTVRPRLLSVAAATFDLPIHRVVQLTCADGH